VQSVAEMFPCKIMCKLLDINLSLLEWKMLTETLIFTKFGCYGIFLMCKLAAQVYFVPPKKRVADSSEKTEWRSQLFFHFHKTISAGFCGRFGHKDVPCTDISTNQHTFTVCDTSKQQQIQSLNVDLNGHVFKLRNYFLGTEFSLVSFSSSLRL